jgi:hypothetical protein
MLGEVTIQDGSSLRGAIAEPFQGKVVGWTSNHCSNYREVPTTRYLYLQINYTSSSRG